MCRTEEELEKTGHGLGTESFSTETQREIQCFSNWNSSTPPSGQATSSFTHSIFSKPLHCTRDYASARKQQ